jgi:hypothetical protein
MSKGLCRSGKGNKKGLSASITNAAVTVIILIVLFSTSSQPIARENVTAATANINSYTINLMPFIRHSLSFKCLLFSQTSSPPRTNQILGVGN